MGWFLKPVEKFGVYEFQWRKKTLAWA